MSMLYIVLSCSLAWGLQFGFARVFCTAGPSWAETEIFPSAARAEKRVAQKGCPPSTKLVNAQYIALLFPSFSSWIFQSYATSSKSGLCECQNAEDTHWCELKAKSLWKATERPQKFHIHPHFMLRWHFPHAQMPLEVFCLESGICLSPEPWSFERVRSENALREGNCKHNSKTIEEPSLTVTGIPKRTITTRGEACTCPAWNNQLYKIKCIQMLSRSKREDRSTQRRSATHTSRNENQKALDESRVLVMISHHHHQQQQQEQEQEQGSLPALRSTKAWHCFMTLYDPYQNSQDKKLDGIGMLETRSETEDSLSLVCMPPRPGCPYPFAPLAHPFVVFRPGPQGLNQLRPNLNVKSV